MAESLVKIFQDVGKAPNREVRIEILKKNDSPALRTLIYYAFHPDVEWLLPPGSPEVEPGIDVDAKSKNPKYLYSQARKLYLFVKGGNDNLHPIRREALWVDLMKSIHPDEAKLLVKVKDSKLGVRGLSYTIAQEAFPDLLPKKELPHEISKSNKSSK